MYESLEEMTKATRRTEEAALIMKIIDEGLRTKKKVIYDVRQMEFLNDTRMRLKRYREKCRISPKQLFYLRDLKELAL